MLTKRPLPGLQLSKNIASKPTVEMKKSAALPPLPKESGTPRGVVVKPPADKSPRTPGKPQVDKDLGASRKALPRIKSTKEKFELMIRGQVDDLLPKPPSEVRIFLSSTFSDMRAERNWLAREAYPKIKQYCYNNLDMDFQVVDLRWGITDDAKNEHMGEPLCLMELAKCQKVSLGPNFVTILGDRYGTCSLPREIGVEEFETLCDIGESSSTRGVDTLKVWYLRDDNAKPPVYVLQPINSILANFGDNTPGNEHLRKLASKDWNNLQEVMQETLRKTAQISHRREAITDQQKHVYFMSVTESEVQDGIFKAEDPNKHCLCFVRRFQGLDNTTLADDFAQKCTDWIAFNSKNILDKNVLELKAKLWKHNIPKHLTRQQIFQYVLPWKPGGVNPDLHTEHAMYLKNFCTHFTGAVQALIDAAKIERESFNVNQEYYSSLDELLHHAHFCKSKCETFRGQKDILQKIRSYLEDTSKRKPLVLHAASGVGKTSVMAMLMKLLPEWFGPECVRVIRFLGTSPDSVEIYNVLFSVMGQLADSLYMLLEPVGYKNMKSLMSYLPRFLRNASRNTKSHVFILLDSVDQLYPNDRAYAMKWLPVDLPANVHVVLSMLPTTNGCLDSTRKVISEESCFLELSPLPETTGKAIITAYLDNKNRTVTKNQRELILKYLKKAPSPLYLRLLLDQALTWRSYTSVESISLSSSVREAINQLFLGLETKFGKTLVSQALGYLTIGLNGLSEMELEDVLSCDDDVLDEVYQFHSPPVEGIVRIPTLLWKRIHHDIRKYIVNRQSQGKMTMFWYHRQFTEAATDRYLQEKQRRLLHTNLANMFMAENGVKRDITLSKRKKTVLKADRQVTAQPMLARNKRMLQALPYHLRRSADLGFMKQVAYCNLKFMSTKIQAFNLETLIRDYTNVLENTEDAPEVFYDQELDLVRNCLQEMKGSMKSWSLLPVELLARVPGENPKQSPYLSKLVKQCRENLQAASKPNFLPLYPCLANLDPLLFTMEGCTKILTMSEDCSKHIIHRTTFKAGDLDTSPYVMLDSVGAKEVPLLVDTLLYPPIFSLDGKYMLCLQKAIELEQDILNIPLEEKRGKSEMSSNRSSASTPALENSISPRKSTANVFCKKVSTDSGEVIHDIPLQFSEDPSSIEYFQVSDDCKYLVCAYNKTRINVWALKDKPKVMPQEPGLAASRANTKLDAKGRATSKYGRTLNIFIARANTPGLVVSKLLLSSAGEKVVALSSFQRQGKAGGLVTVYDRIAKINKTQEIPGELLPDCCCLLKNEQHLVLAVRKLDQAILIKNIDLSSGDLVGEVKLMEMGEVKGVRVGSVLCTLAKSVISFQNIVTGNADVNVKCDVRNMCCVALDDSGEYLCVGDQGGDMHIWTLDGGGSYIGHVNLHKSEVINQAYFTKDNEVLITLGEKGFLCMWNMKQLMQQAKGNYSKAASSRGSKASLGQHSEAVAMAFDGSSKQMVTLDKGGVATLWNLDTMAVEASMSLEVEEGEVTMTDTITLTKHSNVMVAHLQKYGRLAAVNVKTKKILPFISEDFDKNVSCYVVTKDEETLVFLTQDVEKENRYEGYVFNLKDGALLKTFTLKDSIVAQSMQMCMTESGQYLVLKLECNPRELDIIMQAEKKNNLFKCEGQFKFAAFEFSSLQDKAEVELRYCYRHLTKVPCLGQSWTCDSDNGILIGRGRLVYIWDIAGGSCDQRLMKGTKLPTFYRACWIEDDPGKPPLLCHGPTTSMHKSAEREMVAMGSADGWLMVYDINKGTCVSGNVGKKANHGGKVKRVCMSASGKWAASYGSSRTLKMWCIPDKCKEVASMKLDIKVHDMRFTPDSKFFAVIGSKHTGKTKVLLFQVLPGKVL